jgi:dTDP-4-dehydrorhamnose reductase
MRFAILGALGQLGRDLCPQLDGDITPLTRTQADLTRPDTLRETLVGLHPDVVINCAAYNFVDQAEAEPEAAIAVNAWGVRNLALICRDLACTLVHFSTDYVFGLDTSRNQPWTEADAPGPVSVYGLSKLAGEYLVRSICPTHLVVRTCGLYGLWGSGGKGGNFVETMLRVARQGKPLPVVADQVCTPTSTVDVARTTAALLTRHCTGLYHVTNSGSCNWFEFARTIFQLAGISADLTPITSQEFGARARRPAYSVLAGAALQLAGLQPLRSWQEALAAYLEERQRNNRA